MLEGGNRRQGIVGEEEAVIRVRLSPHSSRNALLREQNGVLRVQLTAPPVEGKANRALIAFLAKTLRIPKRAVTIVSGEKARDKTLAIQGMTTREVMSVLDAHS